MASICKRTTLAALAFIALSTAAFSQGRTLPSARVRTLAGKEVDASTLTNGGNPMVVVAWEIVCEPSVLLLNTVHKKYRNWQAETGVRLVAISLDDNRAAPRVPATVRGRGWRWDVFLDPAQEFRRAMNVVQCPHVLVLDGEGRVVWQKVGYAPGDEIALHDAVKAAAAGKSVE